MKIETKRLVLRAFQETDSEDLYEYLSDEEVVRFEPYSPFSRGEAEEEVKRRSVNPNFYAVTLKDNGKCIGNLYLAKGEFDTFEIGYVFNRSYWGKGYAQESAEVLISYAFEKLYARRMVAMCNPLNQSSWKLLERLGFRREGTLIKNIYFFKDTQENPIWQDTYEYAILKEEWNICDDKNK